MVEGGIIEKKWEDSIIATGIKVVWIWYVVSSSGVWLTVAYEFYV
jgi:hypothetical protein